MSTQTQFIFSNFFKDTGLLKDFFERFEYPWTTLSHIDNFITEFKSLDISNEFDEVEKNVFIGQNVKIDSSAKIEGNVIIGRNSTIGHSAYLRKGVILGEDIHIGHSVELKHSLILSKTAIAHLNYVGDSIIGSNCNISGGAILANARLDKKEVYIKYKDEKISTGYDKLGAIIGDNCFIGVNSVINPGTILAPNSIVYPLVSVKGTHLIADTFK